MGLHIGISIRALRTMARFLWLAMPLFASAAAAIELRESLMKAGFVYNFALLTQWPSERQESEFVLCVHRRAALRDALGTLAGKRLGRQTIAIRRIDNYREVDACALVYLSGDVALPSRKLLARIHADAILTVGDHRGFASDGGIIELFVQGNRLRFILNLRAARDAGIRFRAQMIRLADRIIEINQGAVEK